MADLETITARTNLGDVPLWGRFSTFDPARPLILVVRGAFAHRDYLDALPDAAPAYDVVLGHLPGMHSPALVATSIGVFARAYDEAMRLSFAGRAFLRVGISIGGLVVLGMRRGSALVAVEPPVTMAALSPLVPLLRAELGRDPGMAEWIWNIFGVAADRVEPRDYRSMLEGVRVPGIVLIGSDGTPGMMPSLIGTDDRASLSAHPTLEAVVLEGFGHNIPKHRPDALLRAISGALRTLVPGSEP